MSISYSFSGKNILVTGGAQGIGRALVQRFHDAGAKVFTVDKNRDGIHKLLDDLPTVVAVVVDLSNWEETRKAVEGFGRIDHLVNNAGIIIPESFMEVSESTATKNYAVHVGAVYNVSQVVAQGMIERGTGGSIVNVSSVAARIHSRMCSNYGPAKAAVENLTKSMAVELGPHKIRVNCILPGYVETPMTVRGNLPPEMQEVIDIWGKKMFGGRGIDPNEIADLVIFLLSPLSNMITGQGIVIDGGYTAS